MSVYDVLGVAPTATRDELRTAYRRRALELHPDRNLRADGTVPAEVNEAFSRLADAYTAAMSALAFTPAGRAAAPAPAATAPVTVTVPPQRRPQVARVDDPMLTLLTLPHHLRGWSVEDLKLWGLTVVPAARPHLARARRLAAQAGPITGADEALCTAHALLALTLAGLGPGQQLDPARVEEAFGLLERALPASVRQHLSRRVLVGV